MSPAAVALAALGLAIVLSITSRVNVGVVAIGLAWIAGVGYAKLKPDAVLEGFPVSLFVTLAGVTLLFGAAEANGTLARLTAKAVRLVRGDPRWLPVAFFFLASVVSSVGPGAISSVALLAPLAMPIAARAGVPAFLMALAVANGANAGNLSPISSVGLIANGKMAEAGLVGHEFKVWFANFASHLLVTAVAYLVLRGHQGRPATEGMPESVDEGALTTAHWLTVVVVLCWVVGVIGFRLPVGLTGFAAAAVLVLARAADDQVAIRKMPWGVILMVCGMSLLVGVLERTGGLDLFTSLLAKLASASNLNGVIAFVTGSISTYSSTSGVVLPTFLPTVPGLVAQVGGSDPLAVALSINVGSSLVDVSPLSTLGALCVAAVADPAESRRLFQKMLVWGLGMSVVGAVLCQLLAGPLSRW